MIPIKNLTDVTPAIEDTNEDDEEDEEDEEDWCDPGEWWYLVMKVIYCWKLSSYESYLVMKVI